MTPEKKLWQAVVLKAFSDATAENPSSREDVMAKRDAISWITRGGRDYRMVCSLAEIDPDFARDAFLGGRVDGELLRYAERREVAAE